MALTINTSANYGYEIAALFGVPADILNKAKMCGISIKPKEHNPLEFVISTSAAVGGEYLGSVSIKGTAMTLAKAGKLGPASKEVLAMQFSKAIALGVVNVPEQDLTTKNQVHISVDASVPKESLSKAIDDVLMKKKKATKVPSGPFEVGVDMASGDDQTMVVSADPPSGKVDLAMASKVGQAVFGTSKSSTYYVIAMFKGMNMAMRAKFNKLSVRFEGADLDKYKSTLTGLGFKLKDGYASCHFSVDSPTLINKTVGAIIGAIGFQSVVKVGNVSDFVEN